MATVLLLHPLALPTSLFLKYTNLSKALGHIGLCPVGEQVVLSTIQALRKVGGCSRGKQVMLLSTAVWRTETLLRNIQHISKDFSLLLGTLCHSLTAVLSSGGPGAGENWEQWVAEEAEWSPGELHSPAHHLQRSGSKAERCRWLTTWDWNLGHFS